jgi:hypothetical protein
MQDADLLVQLAAIAGVFVGFGALIAVRSGGASDALEVSYIRSVVVGAVWVVVAGLGPVMVGRYGVSGHDLWLVCSVVGLVSVIGLFALNRLAPESRDASAALSRAQVAKQMAGNSVLFVPMVAALVLVVLGLVPDQEPALYITAVVLELFLTALILLQLVFMQRRPEPT